MKQIVRVTSGGWLRSQPLGLRPQYSRWCIWAGCKPAAIGKSYLFHSILPIYTYPAHKSSHNKSLAMPEDNKNRRIQKNIPSNVSSIGYLLAASPSAPCTFVLLVLDFFARKHKLHTSKYQLTYSARKKREEEGWDVQLSPRAPSEGTQYLLHLA